MQLYRNVSKKPFRNDLNVYLKGNTFLEYAHFQNIFVSIFEMSSPTFPSEEKSIKSGDKTMRL